MVTEAQARDTIKKQWDHFSRFIAPDAPAIQRIEMRRAFYAGAMGFYQILMAIPDEEEDSQGVVVLNAITDEFDEFAAAVKAGEA